jgi:hypothetical protein
MMGNCWVMELQTACRTYLQHVHLFLRKHQVSVLTLIVRFRNALVDVKGGVQPVTCSGPSCFSI